MSSPSESATEEPVGTIRPGNDGYYYVITLTKDGRQRWTRCTSAKLNGFKILSLDYLTRHIGKPITIYEIRAGGQWPQSKRVKHYVFIPDGDARLWGKTSIYYNWLRTRSPPLNKDIITYILGSGPKGEDILLEIDPIEYTASRILHETLSFVDA